MTSSLDEIDVGHDPRARLPWHDLPRRTRWIVATAVVLLVGVAGVLLAVRHGSGARSTPTAPVAAMGAPGADVVVDLGPARDHCPAATTCLYNTGVSEADEAAFRSAFSSAGYIGRQTVVDAGTGEVYLQLIRFTTGTLVTVTLTQEPVARAAVPPTLDDTPTDAERGSGSVTLTAVRDGYLMTAEAAGLPGQTLPVRGAQQWVRNVPAP